MKPLCKVFDMGLTHDMSLINGKLLLLKRKILVMSTHEDSVAHIERGSLLFKIQLNVSL